MSNENPNTRIQVATYIAKDTHEAGVELIINDQRIQIDAQSAISIGGTMIVCAATARSRAVMCKLAKRAGAKEEDIPIMLAAHEQMQNHLDALAQGFGESDPKTRGESAP